MAATGALNYYSGLKQSENKDDYSGMTANTLTTISLGYFTYKFYNLSNSAEKIIATAYSVSVLSLVHFLSKITYEAVNNGLEYLTNLIFAIEALYEDSNISFASYGQEL